MSRHAVRIARDHCLAPERVDPEQDAMPASYEQPAAGRISVLLQTKPASTTGPTATRLVHTHAPQRRRMDHEGPGLRFARSAAPRSRRHGPRPRSRIEADPIAPSGRDGSLVNDDRVLEAPESRDATVSFI